MTRTPILSLRGIRKSYGPLEVLHGIDMDVYAGQVVALLGENGAGKSTVSNIISGSVPASSGDMKWQGATYAPATPRAAMDLGVSMIHQELMLLPHLSIAENMFVGRYPTRAGRVDRRQMEEMAAAGLARLGLNISPRTMVDGLSTANRQLIEIAKALTWNAKLLILDEPTAALGGEESALLFDQLDRLRADDVGIIYISHRLKEIKRIADRIIVFRDGAKVQEFDTADLPVRRIVESMVGRPLDQMFPPLAEPSADVIFAVNRLTAPDARFRDVSFDVRRGEIFGIAGLVGAGRSELVRAIAGADPIAAGSVTLNGVDVTPKSPRDATRTGIVLVPEDRKLQGLVLDHSLQENIAYTNLDDVAVSGWVFGRKLRGFAAQNIQKFGVKGTGGQKANELSGGNQQKVVIAKWLARGPKVVLLDEPTRGIDVGARASIYELIHSLAAQGIAVIVVSSDLEEVLGVSNRILVMAAGRAAGILDRKDANDVSIMELATS